MADEKVPLQEDNVQNPEFRFLLESLLAAYEPILTEDLNLTNTPDKIQDPGDEPDCEAEVKLANEIFGRFWNEKVALALLPAAVREQLGPVEKWRWCFLHLRCCMIFGWLLCRGPRGIRGYSYYLKRYWMCVREVLGRPVSNPPTPAETKDFQTLVDALAIAYRPYLQDQLRQVDASAGLAHAVVAGEIDCDVESADAVDVFERMLTPEAAEALLGAEAFAAHRVDPFFWICRCWCICLIRYGCCLAKARTVRGCRATASWARPACASSRCAAASRWPGSRPGWRRWLASWNAKAGCR